MTEEMEQSGDLAPSRPTGKRPTRQEIEERVEYTVFLLCRRLSKGVIKGVLKRRFGVKARTCESYLARARGLIQQLQEKTNGECRLESVRFWESIVSGADATMRDRMHAQEMLDWINGLRHWTATVKGDKDHPVAVEVVEVVVTSRAEAKELLAMMRSQSKPDARGAYLEAVK